MDTSNSTNPGAGIPAPTPGASASGIRRRDVIVGGVAGITSLVAGGVAGGVVGRRLGQQADPVLIRMEKELGPPPKGVDPDELAIERAGGVKYSFAQFGEDLVVSSIFFPWGIHKPTYLDIGAWEPVLSNNTYLFYTRGSRGMLVEPNVGLSAKIRRLRPEDKLLVAGIGIDDTREADYYVMSNPELNTFDKAQVEHLKRAANEEPVQVLKMPLVNINRVIEEHFGGVSPDLISIDIEGLDYAVLKTLDYTRFRPKVICAETVITHTLKHNLETPKLMAEKGYELRGMTYPNQVFVDKAHLPK